MNNYNNSICKCCGQPTNIMTIDDMLENANKYIKNNPFIQNLLKHLNINFEDLNLLQNRSSLENLANNEIKLNDNYNFIYRGLFPIDLNCSEDFNSLESIEIDVSFFRDIEVMNLLKIDKTTDDTYLEDYLKTFLRVFSQRFETILDELTVVNGLIQLRLPNEKFNCNFACNFYPDTNEPYVYYSYNRNKDEISNIKGIKIGLSKRTSIRTNNLGKWLSQQVVIMYPDYGTVCFWFPPDSAAGGIDSFTKYVDKESILYKEFEKWQLDFYNCEDDSFNWNEYNKKGRELYKQLQEIIKNDYILVYCQSFEEQEFRKKELGFNAQNMYEEY